MNSLTRTTIFVDIFALLLFFFVFKFVAFHIGSDVREHVELLYKFINGTETYVTSFLYSFMVYALSGFKNDLNFLLFSAVFVLTVFSYIKYLIVRNIISVEINSQSFHGKSELVASLTSLALCLVFSLPLIGILQPDYYYLGNYPANVWHNSTTIFTMPFVILLFWVSVKQVEAYSLRRSVVILILIVLNALAKPSFLLVYLVAFPLFTYYKCKFSKEFWYNVFPITIAFVLLTLVYVFIYHTDHSSSLDNSSVKLVFLDFINRFYYNNSHLLLSFAFFALVLVGSFLYPAVVLIRNKDLLKDTSVQFALLCTVVAVLMSVFLNETGSKMFHGNFLWQAMMCSFLLFFVVSHAMIRKISVAGFFTYWVEISTFSLHFLSGLYYITRLFTLLSIS